MTASLKPDSLSAGFNVGRWAALFDDKTRIVFGAILLVILCQIWLIFEKAINWDEFLHFGHIYELKENRLTGSLQTLPTRFFGWATLVSQDIVSQIQAVRLIMLACAAITAFSVVVLARRLVDFNIALICGLAYLTAGFVFTNAFTYRPDPMSAAALMSALCLFTFGRLSWLRIATIGMLIGLAGALTIKSIFYAPCFAVAAWLRWSSFDVQKFREFVFFGIIVSIALLTFLALVTLHGAGLPAGGAQPGNVGRSVGSFLRFFEFEQIRYVFAQAIFAPLVTIGLLVLPFTVIELSKQKKILISGLVAPLLCIIFYRNTFPYFFTFLLPPICVAIAPALSKLIDRYGQIPVIIFAFIGPVFLLTQEPYGTLERQRATIDEVERLFPEPTPYLSYSNYIPQYPRQFPSLISGVGLRRYWDLRNGQIANDIEGGKIAFVVATGDALDAVYGSDDPTPILPERDVAALRNNFLQHSDTIYVLGRKIYSKKGAQTIEIVRSGPYSLEGGQLIIDGQSVAAGETVTLKAGPHIILNEQVPCVKMWGLDHVPALPENFPSGSIAGGF